MMMKHAVSLVFLMAGLAPSIGLSGLIGEPAPPLVVKEWIKGQPVAVKAGTNIFVVEIWNASSLVSRVAITNLNALQKRFQTNGVVIVGISDESADEIKEFVLHGGGTNIQYAIAADDQRQTSLGYMKPVGQRAIPYAFVVGTNGNLLWHGHALRGLDKALEQITAGQYDVTRHAKLDVANHQMLQYLGLARRGDARTRAAGRVLLEARTNDVPLLCDLAFQIATAPQIAKHDFALASMALTQAEKLRPTNSARVMITRAVLLFETGKRDEGLAKAKQALASAQSQEDKAEVQSYISTIEARMAVIKSHQSNTNQINTARTSDHVPVANTNQSKGPAGKP
jgi:alkyl hydroperoxide reductase subunit AhpC